MQNSILLREIEKLDLNISKGQKTGKNSYGLKLDGFDSNFFRFHIHHTKLLISKKGDNEIGGKRYKRIKKMKEVFDFLNKEKEEISKKEGIIILPNSKINIVLDFNDFTIFKDIIGNLRSAVEYLPVYLNALEFYPGLYYTQQKKLTNSLTFDIRSLPDNLFNALNKRLKQIWNSFEYYGGENLEFSNRDVRITFEEEEGETKVRVFVLTFTNFNF